eukprot:gene11802-13023_t
MDVYPNIENAVERSGYLVTISDVKLKDGKLQQACSVSTRKQLSGISAKESKTRSLNKEQGTGKVEMPVIDQRRFGTITSNANIGKVPIFKPTKLPGKSREPQKKKSFKISIVVLLVILGLMLLLIAAIGFYFRRNPRLAAWLCKGNKWNYAPLTMEMDSVPGPCVSQPSDQLDRSTSNRCKGASSKQNSRETDKVQSLKKNKGRARDLGNKLCEGQYQPLSDGSKGLLATIGDRVARGSALGEAPVTHNDSIHSMHTMQRPSLEYTDINTSDSDTEVSDNEEYDKPRSAVWISLRQLVKRFKKTVSRLLIQAEPKPFNAIESKPFLDKQSKSDVIVFDKDFQQDVIRAAISEPELVQIDIRHPSINMVGPCNIEQPSSMPVRNKDSIYDFFHKAKDSLKRTPSNGLCPKEVTYPCVNGGMKPSNGKQNTTDIGASCSFVQVPAVNATCKSVEPGDLVAMKNEAAFRFSLRQYTEEELHMRDAPQKQQRSIQSSKKTARKPKADKRINHSKAKEYNMGCNSEFSGGVERNKVEPEFLTKQIYVKEDSLPNDNIDSVPEWVPEMKWKKCLIGDMSSASTDTGIECNSSFGSNFNLLSINKDLNTTWMDATSLTNSFEKLKRKDKYANSTELLKECRVDMPRDERYYQCFQEEHRNSDILQEAKKMQLPAAKDAPCTPCTSEAENPIAFDTIRIYDSEEYGTRLDDEANTCNIVKPVHGHNTEKNLRQTAESLICDVTAASAVHVTAGIHCNSHAAIVNTRENNGSEHIPNKHLQDAMSKYVIRAVTPSSGMEMQSSAVEAKMGGKVVRAMSDHIIDMRGYEHLSKQSDFSVLNIDDSIANYQGAVMFGRKAEVSLLDDSTEASYRGNNEKRSKNMCLRSMV